MLRHSRPALIFLGSCGPCKTGTGWRPTNSEINKMIIVCKQRTKLKAYHGSYLHRFPDREVIYAASGAGPMQQKFILRRTFDRNQFLHHTANHDRYQMDHAAMTNTGTNGTGTVRSTWEDCAVQCNSFWDMSFKYTMKNCDKDSAIRMMEEWGMKFSILDEVSQPRLPDMFYIRHKLYSNNFPWLKEPQLGPRIGDADWAWRGDEKLDYSVYGAKSATLRNEFRSLWGAAPAPARA